MLILNIDTAINIGSFCISNNNDVLAFDVNENRNEQAAWLHAAIDRTTKKNGISLQNIDAVAVSNGPGSYTGLRIGLATAKGLCYALNKPLICLNTLQIMAKAIQHETVDLVCPMIDARRMEVFTALYNKELLAIREPYAEILTVDSFSDTLKDHHITFTGNGCEKFQPIVQSPNVQFIPKNIDARDMISLSIKYFEEKSFQDVAYCEPYYVKDVYILKK